MEMEGLALHMASYLVCWLHMASSCVLASHGQLLQHMKNHPSHGDDIPHDGPCSVSHYFKPKPTGMEVEGLKMEEAYFRGRKLQGTTLPLPQGYSGCVLGKKSADKRKTSDKCEENSNCWEMNAKFQSMTFWNHDNLPSRDDAFLRSLHWFTVANALHQPVTAEDLESASTTQEN